MAKGENGDDGCRKATEAPILEAGPTVEMDGNPTSHPGLSRLGEAGGFLEIVQAGDD